MIERLLRNILPNKLSYFVFGPRQTGKTTLLKSLPGILRIDLLLAEEFLRYNKQPDLLYRRLSLQKEKSSTVWIDEVQKIPMLLDVVKFLSK